MATGMLPLQPQAGGSTWQSLKQPLRGIGWCSVPRREGGGSQQSAHRRSTPSVREIAWQLQSRSNSSQASRNPHTGACSAQAQCFVGQPARLGSPSSKRFPAGSHRGLLSCTFGGRSLGLRVGAKKLQGGRLRGPVTCSAGFEIASVMEVINNLGLDTLTFLSATVVIVPLCKELKISPVLGFLAAGVVLNQLGLFRNVADIEALSDLGILFLLFEMGLELSLERLKALAKYAFGMGLLQVLLSTAVFAAFELPPNKAIGSKVLEFFFHSSPSLVQIRSVDEAVVIGAALALSSSAFVLQLLSEKGELPTRFGSATLGILLMQDIAVVPLLVILPILESGKLTQDPSTLWATLGVTSLKALGGLGGLLLGGKVLLRRIFEVVANSRSPEAFVALCLLTVTGTSLLTKQLGFSDTLGAFLAGALLSETNYRTQVEADIQPFRGLLLGLFFVTTGTSIDLQLLLREWPTVVGMLGGMVAVKTLIVTALGPRFGLSLPESVRTGLLLSQGGEFAFVVLALANQLGVLPLELNRLLIIVVVASMALTPFLNELGRRAASAVESFLEDDLLALEGPSVDNGSLSLQLEDPIVIIGFGQHGQVLANFLSTPLSAGEGANATGWPYVAFDLDPRRVSVARSEGFPVLYGDGGRPQVLQTAGIERPKALMVMYMGRKRCVQAVESLRQTFPNVPIYACAQDLTHLLELKLAGATEVVAENTETSLRLGSSLLVSLGVMSDDVLFLRRLLRESMEARAKEWLQDDEPEGGKRVLTVPIQRMPQLRLRPAAKPNALPAGAKNTGPLGEQAITTVTNTEAVKIIKGEPSIVQRQAQREEVTNGAAIRRNPGQAGVSNITPSAPQFGVLDSDLRPRDMTDDSQLSMDIFSTRTAAKRLNDKWTGHGMSVRGNKPEPTPEPSLAKERKVSLAEVAAAMSLGRPKGEGSDEEALDAMGDSELLEGYMTVEEDPDFDGDDVEGEMGAGIMRRPTSKPHGQNPQSQNSADESGMEVASKLGESRKDDEAVRKEAATSSRH